MTRLPNPHNQLADLEHTLRELRRYLANTTRLDGHHTLITGYPTNGRGQGHASGPGDPLGEAVTDALDHAGTITLNESDAATFSRHLGQAHTALCGALGLLHRTTPTTDAPDDDPGCTSCARVGHWMPTYRGTLCRWCYDWRAAENELPPPTILEAHHRGERITTTLVRNAARQGARR